MTPYDDCWLRYDHITADDVRASYRRRCRHAYVSEKSPECSAIRDELRRALPELLGAKPHFWHHPPTTVDGFLAIGTPDDMAMIAESVPVDAVAELEDGGFLIRAVTWNGADCLVVTASTDRGLVYGTFHLLRLLQLREPIDELEIREEPTYANRLLNQWDTPFRRSVERGYGGESIFDWERLPDLRPRYEDYARLLASVGINGIVLNNVNTTKPPRESANDAVGAFEGWQLLESRRLEDLTGLASLFRRYGIRPYLSVNFAAPMLVGDLDTADPLDENVRDWWREKADDVYELVPDLGGFLIKADSEGQPGPYDYDRDHVDGANAIARALEPHDGRVWWRAFVYGSHEDRAVQAYDTFEPLDGEFSDTVTVQIKNGPIDFQPREPVSTLFGAMPETDLGLEIQLTQEYTGQGVHATYHLPLWKEVFEFETQADGEGTPVKSLLRGAGQGVAGVANVGEDDTWTGHYLSQANLYAFGRVAWNPDLSVETITEEWVRQTFGADEVVVETVTEILRDSWEACIDYETGGLGLVHMMHNGEEFLENHYYPSPAEWPGYHGASEDGIGVDRTERGSGYTTQYRDPIAERYESVETCPEEFLLFFHHLPWDYELDDGTTVVQRLYDNCFDGVDEVKRLRDRWRTLEGRIDERRFRHVAERFDEQVAQAERWRDVLASYFREYSGIPDERGRIRRD
ncbi:alpha-glucuronidase family glycosyl hydrolase [Natrialba asiatica]|uniref:Alpha-glucuronidase n=1 Tax=Natrialba asiatica (strain ATCC 700177 / DSM 12278 / JCM 9576 / FERM P-10747 / NBRC 102637 / 172P1) TaxID=29540 RepID=M0B733_NATA1|nr:alpha-glucuronidase family glycosyl hydrolase [Natrialba asiatica]ELZ06058.1 alpha-glucuronidase [Natrialba asiatica DSM 12278]